ncbi:hypothetical protein DIE23_08290 [Burkholderia sp. Bp9143]|uniref:hypothetical protein n=1 Tax=Burkholderia sp. Bp9143 TaxID=2184574 RepID=UPI000F59FC3B|nr:hypothetical protein [Burkholderia sp. Bp9143]RQR36189.1 hypothetical protein DIE23_08290 [Burkholderia sp. Bp9143]
MPGTVDEQSLIALDRFIERNAANDRRRAADDTRRPMKNAGPAPGIALRRCDRRDGRASGLPRH